ncbi:MULTISPECIES: glycosyltransferase family 2 protein [Winogradskyella]|uniref:glycosyltransferase family 2 protein n=1 Tax=Winogradskyella TaxID=286104 RepID=UPI0015C8AB35|nr:MULTISPECIES: glycosyltransferase family 2 protein [Winogradskyella]QXP80024.1 glycosyltransferase family 2 protein [Winogradskyella sp. HaHa_3_26]
MNPKVTIATITYNSSKYVRKSIESVLAQSFTDFEYLISDDCSTDNTWDIVKEYKDPRIRAWRNETNLREYPNRNKTLFEAKGEYIIWIDGDDIFYPHGLEFMVKMLEAFPNSAMACARPYWKNIVYPYELQPEQSIRFDYLGSPVTINGFPDTLFRTDILKKEGGLPNDYISGDTYVKRKLAMKYPLLLISNGVSWWRMPENQASSKLRGTLIGLLEELRISKVFLEDINCPLSLEEKEIATNNMYGGYFRYIIRNYLFKGRLEVFFSSWLKFKISFLTKVKYAFTPISLPYTGGATADNPLLLPFSDNPYSAKE